MEHIRRTFLKGAGTLAASVVTASVAMAQEGSDMKLSHSSNSAEKPAPIITGVSQAEGIAKFALRASYEDLAPERRERLKVSVLDSLGAPSMHSGRRRSWRAWNRPKSSAARTAVAL
jgi:hypothetical protein